MNESLKLDKYDNQCHRIYTGKFEMERALHTLEGILKGISIDNIINTKEIVELKEWCTSYSDYIKRQPLGEILKVVRESIEDGILDENEREDILWLCNNYRTGNVYFDAVTSDIQRLQGILHGILADGVINDTEIMELKNWIEDNEQLAGSYPYDEIHSLLVSILSDGRIDDDERNLLKVFFSEFIDLNNSCNLNKEELEQLKKEICVDGICSVCPEVVLRDKVFCFTGASSRTKRSEIANIIDSLGGIYHDNVVSETDYLIIGNNGNPCWAFSCYGRKVEKAVSMRKKGHKILIVHENDFWDAVGDTR